MTTPRKSHGLSIVSMPLTAPTGAHRSNTGTQGIAYRTGPGRGASASSPERLSDRINKLSGDAPRCDEGE